MTYTEAVFATWANDRVLSFCFWKAEYRSASAAFAVNVCFAVAKLIFAELEKSAETFIFTAACRDVS